MFIAAHWFSVFLGFVFMDHYQDSFIYLGGLHGYNISNWLISQVGIPGVWLILLATGICFLIYMSARTIIWLRKLFSLSFLKRKQKKNLLKLLRPLNHMNMITRNLRKWNLM